MYRPEIYNHTLLNPKWSPQTTSLSRSSVLVYTKWYHPRLGRRRTRFSNPPQCIATMMTSFPIIISSCNLPRTRPRLVRADSLRHQLRSCACMELYTDSKPKRKRKRVDAVLPCWLASKPSNLSSMAWGHPQVRNVCYRI
ncbi:hypothetical protein BDU57DRAFT_192337 [Ampelomyces quisqualis]|uniref:Uncharacterized protein n=1 Tax=Ampelomyces quisqualis TaxID=50730 RepID=A0A6A5QWI4_AMPQU|nr:hypothetical protein BDU57DRAFT_192337 [Ampelomyces quisqualis]